MKNYLEVYEIIKNEMSSIESGIEEVELLDSFGRVLSENIYSVIDMPAFDNSAMDGIIIKYQNDITSWNIIGEISAGNYKDQSIGLSDASLIMTGAKLPSGGDTVIPVEDLIIKNNFAKLKERAKVKKGQNIRKTGQDLKKYQLIASRNITIKPQQISLIASCGISKVKVFRKLNIGVLSTGDELIDLDQECNEDSVHASNLYSIIALVMELGMDYTNFGIVKDDKQLLKQKIKCALDSGIDILITIGGVSVGKFDHVQDILKDFGAEIVFWKVNIKPGKPLLFAKISVNEKKVLIFGLPGNPVSSFVNFHLFIRNVLQETFYHTKPKKVYAELKTDLKKNDNKRHFIMGIIEQNGHSGKIFVRGLLNQSSSNMAGLSVSNALIIIEESRLHPKAGEEVECIMI